jgi:hypothetical protein
MDLFAAGIGYLSIFAMIFDFLLRLIGIYTMFMAIKAFKLYIKKNSNI